MHLVLFALLAWTLSVRVERAQRQLALQPVIEEPVVALLFPDQILEVPVPLMRTDTEPEPPTPPPPPPKPKERPYIRTTQNAAADAAPKNAPFVSDRNTRAASMLPPDPDGVRGMPTLDGKGPAQMELADRDYKDGKIKDDAATPQAAMAATGTAGGGGLATPTPQPPQPPAASPPQPPIVVAKAEPIKPGTPVIEDMVRETPTDGSAKLPLEIKRAESPTDTPPTPPTPATPATPPGMLPPGPGNGPAVPGGADTPVKKTAGKPEADSFSPFTRTSRVKGTLSNRGEAAVDAAETPLGKYMRVVTGAVEKRWHTLRRQRLDAASFGSMKLRFYVKANGDVLPPELLSDRSQANAAMIDFTLQAVMEAEIPPIPKDLLPLLEKQRLEVEYDVLIY